VHLADEPASNGPDGFPFLFGDTREMTAADPVFLGDGAGCRPFDHQIAIHEAGHTVASYMLLSVAGSTIEYVGGHFGRTWANDIDIEAGAETVESICSQLAPLMAGALADELEQAHCHCIEYLAGTIAEELFCGELLPNTQHDLDAARAVAGLIVREIADIDSYIDLARTETRALLSTHTASVLAIAHALVEHRTIGGDMIERIIREFEHKPRLAEQVLYEGDNAPTELRCQLNKRI
jgi:hypothetical protein